MDAKGLSCGALTSMFKTGFFDSYSVSQSGYFGALLSKFFFEQSRIRIVQDNTDGQTCLVQIRDFTVPDFQDEKCGTDECFTPNGISTYDILGCKSITSQLSCGSLKIQLNPHDSICKFAPTGAEGLIGALMPKLILSARKYAFRKLIDSLYAPSYMCDGTKPTNTEVPFDKVTFMNKVLTLGSKGLTLDTIIQISEMILAMGINPAEFTLFVPPTDMGKLKSEMISRCGIQCVSPSLYPQIDPLDMFGQLRFPLAHNMKVFPLPLETFDVDRSTKSPVMFGVRDGWFGTPIISKYWNLGAYAYGQPLADEYHLDAGSVSLSIYASCKDMRADLGTFIMALMKVGGIKLGVEGFFYVLGTPLATLPADPKKIVDITNTTYQINV